MDQNIVTRAADAVGGKSPLAKAVGFSYQAIQQWEQAGYVPPKRIPAVAAASGIDIAEFYAAYQRASAAKEAA
ncbi:carph-isopro domain-containing protein [Paludibacterium purpuratum]|uniref:YdaS antitoxin of YdaST toxin-antitoxin system n=1 Tax=Paludibacterium purpuratum TaxID=1144873 RepID=A0A4R7BB59_9NEIS|nr:YdaS family helix-turn-helix protein [Paludibacterium purpuratum]TDR82184.1 YdaS antitoxin of YdaST toxin-antitoxin system [Paludibacterium purpuratum]